MKIKGEKILLVGNRGHKNMGDELILVGNIKLLLKEGKKIYIACSNKKWLKNFHSNFLSPDSIEKITYLQELPKGLRSSIKFFKNIKDLKYYFQTDSILVGGGEIFTEETPGSYWYWLASVWFLLFGKNLYLSGGIQIPKKIWNKIPYWILTKKAKKLYVRDYDLQNNNKAPKWLKNKIEFFPDTSIFVYDDIDLNNFIWNLKIENKQQVVIENNGRLEKTEEKKEYTPYIIVNVNKRAEKFLTEIKEKIDYYYRKDYDIYFVPVCKSPKDMDINYYHKLKESFPAMKLLDWENWDFFIEKLALSEKVFTTRLHLFLISYYLGCNVQPFVYQKKVEKMKQVLKYDKS